MINYKYLDKFMAVTLFVSVLLYTLCLENDFSYGKFLEIPSFISIGYAMQVLWNNENN